MALVGRYETYEPLGMEATGTIYRARDVVLGREVSLRILTPECRLSSRLLRSFSTTGQVSPEWLHPNIAVIHDLGESARGPFIATEFLAGANMRSYIRSRSALSLLQKLDLLVQASTALAHAHKNEIVHSGISPDSFFIDERQQVKLMDLGIRHTRLPGESGEAGAEALRYFAPEQLSNGVCDSRSDVFSAALVFFEFLTNVHPLLGSEAGKRMEDQGAVPLLKTDTSLPKPLENLLIRALSKNPEDRPQSATELAAGIRSVTMELMATVAPPSALLLNQQSLTSTPLERKPSFPDKQQLRSSLAGVSPFTWKVAATLLTAVIVILLAYLANSAKQQNQHVVAEAQVRVAETSLFESADLKSQSLIALNRGVRLEILDRVPSRSDRFVHVQQIRRRKGSPIGYVLKDDLTDWRSDDPQVSWELLASLTPPALASSDETDGYIASLQSYIERFPSGPHVSDAKLRLQQLKPEPAPVVAKAAEPPSPEKLAPAGAVPPIPPAKLEQLRRLVDQLPALWEEGDLENIMSVSGRALSIDPGSSEARSWRSRAQKALRKLNDQ